MVDSGETGEAEKSSTFPTKRKRLSRAVSSNLCSQFCSPSQSQLLLLFLIRPRQPRTSRAHLDLGVVGRDAEPGESERDGQRVKQVDASPGRAWERQQSRRGVEPRRTGANDADPERPLAESASSRRAGEGAAEGRRYKEERWGPHGQEPNKRGLEEAGRSQ